MTISTALTAALSGLTAASKGAAVVSDNIANAGTEGYGVRSLSLSSIVTGSGQGVRVNGVSRNVDPVLLAERRSAQASKGEAETRSTFLNQTEKLIGTPDDSASISARLDGFEASLVSAISRPDSQARLESVVNAASYLSKGLNDVSDGIQSLRLQADQQIGTEVDSLNRTLAELHDLNGTIRTAVSRGEAANGLLDRQQQLIDGLADLLPIREVRNEAGMVSLYTADGLSLLDGHPSEFGFTKTAAITPLMTVADGDLSGLTVNGRAINTSGSYASISGGRLAALFAVRDDLAVTAQARVDGLARDLTERLDTSGLDPTLSTGDPGLFTDDGLLATSAYEVGLAGRITVNAAVDPAMGGDTWRLRDGIGAVAEGAPGDPGLLQGVLNAVQSAQPTGSQAYSGTSRNLSELGSDLLSLSSMDRQFAETRQAETTGTYTVLHQAELTRGVDTDTEMQHLLQIERAYSANAKVLSTLNDMLDRLLGL